MSYNLNYNKILQDRVPFQISISNQIKKRNQRVLNQEEKMKIKLLEKNNTITKKNMVSLSVEKVIQRLCKKN